MTIDDRTALIRQLRRSGATHRQLSVRFDVSIQRISAILKTPDSRHGVPCPICDGDSAIIRTGRWAAGYLPRRHQCRTCGHRWTSHQKNV